MIQTKLSAAALIFAAVQSASALIVTVPTSQSPLQPGTDNQGWYSLTQSNNNPTNDNYITGNSDFIRSWFAFDLSSVSGTVVSARLDLRRYDQTGTVNIFFHDVTTPAAQLPSNRGQALSPATAAIFNDLGSGTPYGNYTVVPGGSLDILSFALNNDALTDINAALGGYFAVGARVTSPAFIFASSGSEPGNGGPGFTQDLVLEVIPNAVPDAGSFMLLSSFAFLSVSTFRRWIR